MALMGAFTTMLVSLIMPVVFYAIVRRHHLTAADPLVCGALLLGGFTGMALGVQGAFAQLD